MALARRRSCIGFFVVDATDNDAADAERSVLSRCCGGSSVENDRSFVDSAVVDDKDSVVVVGAGDVESLALAFATALSARAIAFFRRSGNCIAEMLLRRVCAKSCTYEPDGAAPLAVDDFCGVVGDD